MANYNFLKEAKVWFVPISETGVEEGLTLTASHTANTQVPTTVGSGFHSSERGQPTTMAADVVLPATFSNNHECLFEHGGTGNGTWLGVVTENSQKYLYFRSGNGLDTVTTTNNQAIVARVLVSSIAEFDGAIHTVVWEIDPTIGSLKLWIDNRPVINEVTSNKSNFINSNWSGGNFGGLGQGYDSIAGRASADFADYQTAWSGAVISSLRVYHNQKAYSRNNHDVPILLDVGPNLQFNQTFTDNSFGQKTLHEPTKMFQASSIKKANPADISFTIPIYEENDFAPVYECLRELNSHNRLKQFDLYIQLPNDLYLIKKCVIISGSFITEKLKPLLLEIQAQGSKLIRYTSTEASNYTSAFNSLTRSNTKTHQIVSDHLSVEIDSTPLDCLSQVKTELQNKVEWIENKTVNTSIALDTNAFSYWNLVDNTTYDPFEAASQDDSVAQTPSSTPAGSFQRFYVSGVDWAADRSYFDLDLAFEANSGWGGEVLSFTFDITIDTNKLDGINGGNPTVIQYVDPGDAGLFGWLNNTPETFRADILDFNDPTPRINNTLITTPGQDIGTFRIYQVSNAYGKTTITIDRFSGAGYTAENNGNFSLNLTDIPKETGHLSINSSTGVVTFNNTNIEKPTKASYSYTVQAISVGGKVLQSTNYTQSNTGSLSNSDVLSTTTYNQLATEKVTFPDNFVVVSRSLSGSVTQYITDSTSHKYVQTHKIGTSVSIEAGKNNTTGFQFSSGQCSFTNRNTVADAFTQSFDWKMNSTGSSDISSILKINNS